MNNTEKTITKPNLSNDTNRDPLSDAPGAHPVGTGIGAMLGGVAAGAAAGTAAGPVGTFVGLAVGAIAGGLVGKDVAESVDPTAEEVYWRESFKNRPYSIDASFDDYGPAYAYGVSSYLKYPYNHFDDVETNLARDWNTAGGNSTLEWAGARIATKEAWDRLFDKGERIIR
jgi:hypothetical protein